MAESRGAEYREKYQKIREDLTIDDQPNLDDVYHGAKELMDICLSCDKDTVVEEHPLFEASLCRACYDDMKTWGLCCGAEGTRYCVICTNCGDMLVCDNHLCTRAYCYGCIRDLVSETELSKLLIAEEDEKWECFYCAEWAEDSHGLLRPRSPQETLDRLRSMHAPTTEPGTSLGRLRVLSLFDGIGAGIVALKCLNLQIGGYYSSEIDPDAMLVTQTQHPEVRQLGDVRELTPEKLQHLGPFDLLIGGSPCDELSRANPNRKGLYGGTGKLFFEYYRIKSTLECLWPRHRAFYLYENVDGMGEEAKSTISRFFNSPPAVWDACVLTPMRRRRYFWGNIPGLASPPEEDRSFMLSQVLMPNRRPNVKKLATITTQRNSMLQGKQNKYPVTMGKQGSVLWTSEFEMVFGFPRHYTDIGDLDRTKRQKLVGKSWSVTTVMTILSPLRFFFRVKE